jgi:beta-galactosidase
MNGGVTEAEGAAQALDVAGINYQLYAYDEFHGKFPDIPVIGTETTSAFMVRGCYETDYGKNLIACYDEDRADWGNTVRETWQCLENRDFASGGFMWTGFDYLGEPTPFEYPSVSSFFGMMDVCGFEKDAFWLSKAIFADEPVCHLLPHWNFRGREGEIIKVMSCTNCEEAELFVNGKSCGRKQIDKLYQTTWEVAYEPGEIKLVGYNGGEKAAECLRETTDEAAEIRLEFANLSPLANDGLDAAIVNFIAVDSKGREVPDFCGKMRIEIEGGTLIGAANGDPNCHEPFDSCERSLFNGRAQAIIRPEAHAHSLTIGAECGKLRCNALTVSLSEPGGRLAVIPAVDEIAVTGWRVSARLGDSRPDPMMKIASNDMNSLEPYVPKNGDGGKMADSVGKWALFRAETNIPEKLNGKLPTIHFNQIWGKGEVWVNGKKRLDFDCEWGRSADIPCTEDMTGKAEITAVVQSVNKYGAGIISSVVIR